MQLNSLSVFMPAFNEEENIGNVVRKIVNVLEDLKIKNFEVIVVNDASVDQTEQVAQKIADRDKRVKVVSHEINQGYGGALKTGYEAAKYPWVAFIDSDDQFDFAEISKFLSLTDLADVILGYRLNRADSFNRKVFTFGWKVLARILLGLSVKDYSCGFKLLKKQAYQAVLPLESGEKVTQIEMLVKMKRQGFRFAQVGVHHFPRKHGIPTGAKLKVVVKSLADIFRLWWDLR